MTAERKQSSCAGRFFSGARNIILFTVALFSVGAIQSRSVTVPTPGSLGRKWAHFEEQGDRYSFVFIGSSRVAHHFIAEQFDAALRDAGHEVTSFNFGQDGMFPPESFYVLRKLLDQTPARPRWVAVDLMNFRPILKGNEEAERAIAWHDWRHTLLTCRMLLSPDFTPGADEPGLFYHTRLLATRTIGEGRWQDWLQRRMKLNMRLPGPVTMSGYEALEPRPLGKDASEKFEQDVEKLKAAIAPIEMPAVYRRELEELVSAIRERGAEPVFVVSPDIHAFQRFRDWPPAGVAQFSYDHPETYPTLYLSGQRYDSGHLDKNGAKEFTRIFATEFADWLKRK